MAVAGLGLALALAACSSGSSAPPPTSPASTTAPTATTTTASAPPPSPTAATTTTAFGSSTGSVPGGAYNLTVTDAVRAQLLDAASAESGIPVGHIQLVPGATYFAYYQPGQTYVALTRIEATPSATHQDALNLQQGGNRIMAERPATGTWSARSTGVPPACSIVAFFPSAVLELWGQSVPAGVTC